MSLTGLNAFRDGKGLDPDLAAIEEYDLGRWPWDVEAVAKHKEGRDKTFCAVV